MLVKMLKISFKSFFRSVIMMSIKPREASFILMRLIKFLENQITHLSPGMFLVKACSRRS